MDYETQNAIDRAVSDCERKIDDVRYSYEREVQDLRREINHLDEKLNSLRAEVHSHE